ncbi:hypothetical protein BD769DRAFT_1545555 [Suillus cothurnatus]|nr:hypothetical protein BD769DRAFT_1545555 [Suillus cothurnatus]
MRVFDRKIFYWTLIGSTSLLRSATCSVLSLCEASPFQSPFKAQYQSLAPIWPGSRNRGPVLDSIPSSVIIGHGLEAKVDCHRV